MIRGADLVGPKQLQPATPDLFEEIVLKMLARGPEDRYQTAKELLADLARIAPDPV